MVDITKLDNLIAYATDLDNPFLEENRGTLARFMYANRDEILAALKAQQKRQTIKDRADKLGKYGVTSKESRQYKLGFILLVDSVLFRDSCDGDPEYCDQLIAENTVDGVKRSWLADADQYFVNPVEYQIVSLETGDVVETGKYADYLKTLEE